MTPLVLLHPCVKRGNRYKDQDAVIELRTRNFPFQRENSGQYAVIIQLDIVQPVELSPIDIIRRITLFIPLWIFLRQTNLLPYRSDDRNYIS